MLIPYDFVSTRGAGGSTGPDALTFRGQLVRTVPPCVPGRPGRQGTLLPHPRRRPQRSLSVELNFERDVARIP